MPEDELLTQIDSCTACGQCLPVCPVYALTGIETDSPRGRILITGALAHNEITPEAAVAAFSRCLLCGRCERACPQELPLQKIFFNARLRLAKLVPVRYEVLIRSLAHSAKVLDFCQPPAYLAQKLLKAKLPLPAFNPFTSKNSEKGRVLFFAGCLTRRFFPDLASDCLKALQKCGYSVIWAPDLVCCGRPQAVQGRSPERAIRTNLSCLARYEFEWLASPCPGCIDAMLNLWAAQKNLKEEEQRTIEAIQRKAIDICLLLVQAGAKGKQGDGFWHSPCLLPPAAEQAALELCGLKQDKPDEPLCCAAGLNLVQTCRPRLKAGPGRLFRPDQLPLNEAIKKRILKLASRNNLLTTACPGCMLALRDAIPARHVVQAYMETPD